MLRLEILLFLCQHLPDSSAASFVEDFFLVLPIFCDINNTVLVIIWNTLLCAVDVLKVSLHCRCNVLKTLSSAL